MRIAVVAGQLGAHAWTRGHFADAIMKALGARGHVVDLVAYAAEDPAMFDCATISLMRPFEHNMPDRPRELAAWVRTRPEVERADVVLSLSRAVPIGVWMPMDPTLAGMLHQALADQGLIHKCLWMARHHPALAVDRVSSRERRRWGWGGGRAIDALVVFGPAAARRARSELPGLADRIIESGYASTMDPPLPDMIRHQGRLTRSTLRIAPSRRVVLLSCNSTVGTRLDPFLMGLNRCIGEGGFNRRAWPVVIVLTPVPFAVHDAACRIGCQRALRVLGTTRDAGPLFAAADCVAAPIAAEPNPFASAAVGRFVADALRTGRPVIAARGAPGADALEATRNDAARFVDERNPTAWFEALRDLCATDWVEHAGDIAMRERSRYALDILVDLLEDRLQRAAAR